jgi:DNA-binding protein HU-beta
MNKGDLVEAVAKVVGKKKLAQETVGCVLETMTEALKKGESVTLIGFGTFKVTKRAARTGRNPQTGKAIKIKAKKVPKFTAGKKLKDAVAAKK